MIDTGSRLAGEPVYDIAADVADAAAKLDRLMRDEAGWQRASRRVAAHFAASHSIDAVLDRYEQVLAAQAGRR